MWNLEGGHVARVLELECHAAGVSIVKLASNECLAILASDDGTAQIWDLACGACIGVLPANSPVSAVSGVASGKFVLGTIAGEVVIVELHGF
jgi:WD40 repeat protein